MTGLPEGDEPRLRLAGLVVQGSEPFDLDVAAGDVVAITGWGSSELLWTVAGLDPAGTGEVRVDGSPVRGQDQAHDAGVVLIPQGNGLASILTACENVVLPVADHPGRDAAAAPGAARDALEAVGLLDSADHLVEELSGGQQQRVAVARALAARPRVLLADQATTDLDAANRARVLGLLRGLAATGAAVLMASDDPAVVEQCDRTVAVHP